MPGKDITVAEIRKFAARLHNPPELIGKWGRSLLAGVLTNRIHDDLLAADLSSYIGIPPTPMYETEDARNNLDIVVKGMVVVEYGGDIEDLMDDYYGRTEPTEIYNLSERELDNLEEAIESTWDELYGYSINNP